MRMLKNDIPMLEYDFHPAAVIMPDRENLDLKLPAKAVFAFLGEAVDINMHRHITLKWQRILFLQRSTIPPKSWKKGTGDLPDAGSSRNA